MDTEYMEALARAYKEALSTNVDSSLVEEALLILTRQLAVIADVSARTIPKNSALGYLQTLKMETYTALIAQLPKDKAPVRYTSDRGNRSYVNYLISTQTELFTILDKLEASGIDLGRVQRNETRAFTAIVAL